jgi:hypothetical protein
MRSKLLLLFLLLFPSQSIAQQDLKCDVKSQDFMECLERGWRSYLGKYLCLIDHVSGIQYDNDAGRGQPFVGRIRPTEDKFFMEISEDSSSECRHLPSFPSSIDNCRTKYKMTVKSKSIFLRQDGWSATNPQTFMTDGGKMVMVAGGRFGGNYNYGWNSYAFEGRCEKLN